MGNPTGGFGLQRPLPERPTIGDPGIISQIIGGQPGFSIGDQNAALGQRIQKLMQGRNRMQPGGTNFKNVDRGVRRPSIMPNMQKAQRVNPSEVPTRRIESY